MSHVDEGVLHAYLDGELPPGERAAVESHVAQCPQCRGRLDEERALIARAGQLLGLARPVDTPAPPLQQLRERRSRWRVRMPLAWAASIILALAVGYTLRSPEPVSAPIAASRDEKAQELALNVDSLGSRQRSEQKPAVTVSRDAQRTRTNVANEMDSRADSVNYADRPAAGVVAIQPPAVAAPPTPLPQQPLGAARTEASPTAKAAAPSSPSASISGVRGAARLLATEWPIIRRGSARAVLGSEPVGVPGLAVREIRRSPEADGTILVEQQIDSSTIIQLYQRPVRTDERRSAAALERGTTDRLARFVGGVRVEIAGPLSQDSLNRLLEQLKPLP